MRQEDIDLFEQFGYICHDPTCTASHVNLDDLPDGPTFIEVPPCPSA